MPRDPWDKTLPDKVLMIQLSPASDLSVVVTLPDGKSAVGAKVAPLIYGYDRGSVVLVPSAVAEKIGSVTDQQGRARLPAALARDRARRTVVIQQGYGQQYFFLQQSDRKQNRVRATEFVVGEPELRLRPVGRIEVGLIATSPNW